jgi:hypothetical protein
LKKTGTIQARQRKKGRRCGEMADAQDLKSWDRKKSCEFESHHRHQPWSETSWRAVVDAGTFPNAGETFQRVCGYAPGLKGLANHVESIGALCLRTKLRTPPFAKSEIRMHTIRAPFAATRRCGLRPWIQHLNLAAAT